MASVTNKSESTQKILRIGLLLFVVTAIEFVFAFLWPDTWSRLPLNLIFILLTLVKAFYIVADFMHLKSEVKFLVYSIILPVAFVCWLIAALLIEGDAIINAINSLWR